MMTPLYHGPQTFGFCNLATFQPSAPKTIARLAKEPLGTVLLKELHVPMPMIYISHQKSRKKPKLSFYSRPATQTTKTISSASDSLRSSILTSNERSLRENGDVYTYVNFQPEILNCEMVTLFLLKHFYQFT